MAYVNQSFTVGQVLTAAQMNNVNGNFLGLANGDATPDAAPKIQTAALEQTNGSEAVTTACIRADAITNNEMGTNAVDTNEIATDAVTAAKIDANAVGESEITTNAIHQAELYVTYGAEASSGTIGSGTSGNISLAGGTYTLNCQVKWSGVATGSYAYLINVGTATTYTSQMGARCYNGSISGRTAYARTVYVGASPPYDLGDGEFDYFLMALLDENQELQAIYAAHDPIWYHNGKTHYDVVKKKKDLNGNVIKFTTIKNMDSYGQTWQEAVATDDRATILAYVNAYKSAENKLVRITKAMKNVNMNDLPHPWTAELIANPTWNVVMVDPWSPLVERLKDMYEHDDFTISDIDQHIDFTDNSASFITPPNVIAVQGKFK